MKIIIAGSRPLTGYKFFCKYVENSEILHSCENPIILSGCARGPDMLAIRWARERGFEYLKFPADWSKGRGAGLERNILMAKEGDALIALWDGYSRGTKHMIEEMERLGKPSEVCLISPQFSKGMEIIL